MALTIVEAFEKVLSHFPVRHLRMVFAYGSGVFQQHGHKDMSKNMLDFIYAVDDPLEWHRENLERNPKHYSSLKYLGPKRIASIQQNFGASVYFNTLVHCEGRLIKYGVISTQALMNDLLDWETLYVAGRLHKPVNIVWSANMPELTSSILSNYQSAVHTALLLLSDTFTEEQLYHTIAGLSYSGDFRMKVGEDKNKVANIVGPNKERFRNLYEHILECEQHLHWNKTQGTLEQSLCSVSRYHHLNLLPKMVQLGLVAHQNKDGRFRDAEDVLRGISMEGECGDLVQQCVADIVKQSSVTQSAKGMFTAGLVKTIRYSWNKMKKMWKSR